MKILIRIIIVLLPLSLVACAPKENTQGVPHKVWQQLTPEQRAKLQHFNNQPVPVRLEQEGVAPNAYTGY